MKLKEAIQYMLIDYGTGEYRLIFQNKTVVSCNSCEEAVLMAGVLGWPMTPVVRANVKSGPIYMLCRPDDFTPGKVELVWNPVYTQYGSNPAWTVFEDNEYCGDLLNYDELTYFITVFGFEMPVRDIPGANRTRVEMTVRKDF